MNNSDQLLDEIKKIQQSLYQHTCELLNHLIGFWPEQEWIEETNDLAININEDHMRLEEYLTAIGWDGSDLPSDPVKWREWFSGVITKAEKIGADQFSEVEQR